MKTEKILSFGKIDYNNCGRKLNLVTLTVRLYDNKSPQGLVFTVVCDVYNSKRTDVLCCGQCLDNNDIINKIRDNRNLYLEITKLWQKYGNNDMHAGTPKQEELVKNMPDDYKPELNRYDRECAWLEEHNLLRDTFNGQEDVYRRRWFYHPIEEHDLNRIREFCQ